MPALVGDDQAPTDCTTCGCCCFSTQPNYIRVFAADEARMDARALALTCQDKGNRAMRFVAGRCAALNVEGEIGRYRCAIYAARPDCCRWLERGSGECLTQIADKREARSATLGSDGQ